MSRAVISRARAPGLFFYCVFFCVMQAGAASLARADTPLAIDACTLLRTSEIAQIVGTTVVGEPTRQDAGKEPDGSYSSSCVWELKAVHPAPQGADAPLNGKSFVILHVMQWPPGSDKARGFLESFREAARNGDIPGKTVPRNFGDEALWWGDGLAVRKRNISFGLSVFYPGAKVDHRGVFEERLAPYILTRLGKRAARG